MSLDFEIRSFYSPRKSFSKTFSTAADSTPNLAYPGEPQLTVYSSLTAGKSAFCILLNITASFSLTGGLLEKRLPIDIRRCKIRDRWKHFFGAGDEK